nr:hypothetical protein [Tanacetum cinerariifolium]
MESIHVNFDELPQMGSVHISSDPAPEFQTMASDQLSSDPVPKCQKMALKQDSLSPGRKCQENTSHGDKTGTTLNELCQENISHGDKTVTTLNELDLLFSLMFDELLNGPFQVVSKSSAVPTADESIQRQQQQSSPLNNHTTPAPTCQIPTLAPTVMSYENINQAELNAENDQVADDEFINIFSTPVQDQGETSSRHEEVYVNQPDGFVDPYHLDQVYRLKMALYGLKQAPRAWYDELSKFLLSKGFTKGSIDPTLFITKHRGDILLAKYAQEILIKHGMTSCDGIGTPMATKHIDADLSETPVDQTKYHRKYLKDTIHMGLWYPKDTGFELTAFLDSDHAGCLDSCKSISGGIQFLCGDKLVSWSSKKQDCTSMSSAEAEYVSLSACCAHVLWMRTQLTDYGFYFDKIPLYCDSKAAIAISCNPVQHSCTKHIDVRYHFIKGKVEKGIVELFFVGTEYQLADLFTKALHVERFQYLVRRLGMRCLTPAELEDLANEPA